MLVSTEWLAERLDDPGIRVVDLRWREDGSGRTLFERGHVPGAAYLDWSADLVDPGHPVAFMLAPPDRFAAAMEAAGIGDDTTVVAYADEQGSGPMRLWWGCAVYGHDRVRVLDGGLERWVREGRPVTTAPPDPRTATFTPRRGEPLVCGADEVAAAERDPRLVVLDARPPEQYRGEEVWFETGPVRAGPDGIARTPRGDLRAGRVPWARSLPAAQLYRPDGTLKPAAELHGLLAAAGVEEGSRVLTYCGVGIAAAAAAFAARLAGIRDVALYDASWEEWGRDPARPAVRG